MSEGPDSVEAGRIELEVVAEFGRDFERKLKREADARVRDIRVKLRAEIDARRLAIEARAAARAAQTEASIRLKATVDETALRRDLAALVRDIGSSADLRVKVTADVDRGRLRDDLAAAARDSQAPVTVPVSGDTKPAEEDADRFRRKQRSKPVTLPFGLNLPEVQKAGQLVATLGKVGATAAGFLLAASGATALAGGLVAVAAAGSQAVGVLSILPGVATAGIQGLATLLVGFNGVGTALGALSKADKASGASAGAAAAAREAAAERIKQAERSIRDAVHQRMLAAERVGDSRDAAVQAAKAVVAAEERVKEAVARVSEARERAAEVAAEVADRQAAAARAVEMAERRYVESQRSSQRATEALSEARKIAKERVEDLALAVRGGALDERGAQLGIERAKQQLDRVNADPFADSLSKREAQLAYDQALLRLDEVKERNGDLAEEKADSDRRGVEGSKEVEAAKERLTASIQAEKDAEYELGQARKQSAKTAVEGAKAVAQANEGITAALRGVKDAADDVEQARKAQVRAERDVREALWSQMLAAEALTDAQRELAKAKKAASTAGAGGGGGGVDPVAQALAELSPKMRELVLYLHNKVRPELRKIKHEVQEAIAPGVKDGVEAALPMLETLRSSMGATGSVIGVIAKDFGEFLGSKSFNLDLSQIMGRNNQALALFGKAGKSAFKGIIDFLVEVSPRVVDFADAVKRGADTFARFTSRTRKSGEMADFFSRAWEMASKLWRIVKNLGGVIGGLIKASSPAGGTLLEDLAVAAEDFNKWINQPEVQERLRKFFDNLVPLLREAGGLIKDVVVFLGKLTEAVVNDGTLTDFITFLRDLVGWLTGLTEVPIIGDLLKWVFILGLVAIAVGTVAAKLGGLIKVLRLVAKAGKGLSKLTGLSKLFGGKGKDSGGGGGGGDLPGGGDDGGGGDGKRSRSKKGRKGKKGGKTGGIGGVDVGDLADVADALADVGDSSEEAGKKTRGFGKDVEDAGRKADVGGKKAGLFSRALSGIKGAVGKAGSGLAGLAGLLGLDKLGDLAGKVKAVFAKIDLGSVMKKINPASLISGVGQKINPEGWIGKLNPKSLLSGVGQKINPAAWISKLNPKSLLSSIGSKINPAAWIGKLNPRALLSSIGSKINPAAWIGKLSPASLISGVGQKINPEGWISKLNPANLFGKLKTKIDISGWFSKIDPTDILTGGGGGKGKKGKGKKGKGGKGGVLGDALSLGSTGAEVGSVLGPPGAAVAGGIGAAAGALRGSGADPRGNPYVASLLDSLDMYGGVGKMIEAAAFPERIGAMFTQGGSRATQAWTKTWAEVGTITQGGVQSSVTKLGLFASGASAKFLTIKDQAPAHVREAWSAIQTDIDAGLPPSQQKIDAFVRAGGAKFLDLKGKAPQAMRDMLSQIQSDAGSSLTITSQRLADFVGKGNTKFLELKAGAPKSLREAWSSIQSDAAAGLPPSKAKIDKFVQDGGAKFLGLKKDAPAHARAAWKEVENSTTDLSKAQGKIGEFNDKAKLAFSGSKNAISTTWSGLPGALSTPLRTVIDKLYNGGIVKLWNSVAPKVGLSPLPTISVAFAEGGVVADSYGVQPGYAPGRDTMLAAVSPGEAWLVPQVARWLGKKTIDGWNRMGMGGRLPKFAAGGVVGSAGNPLAAFGLGVSGPDEARQAIEAAQAVDQLATRITAAIRDAYSGSGGVIDMLRTVASAGGGSGSGGSGGGGGGDADTGGDGYPSAGEIGVAVSDAVAAQNDMDLGVVDRLVRVSPGGRYSGAGMIEGGYSSTGSDRAEPGKVEVNVFPQPGQSEFEIGTVAARKVGSFIR